MYPHNNLRESNDKCISVSTDMTQCVTDTGALKPSGVSNQSLDRPVFDLETAYPCSSVIFAF